MTISERMATLEMVALNQSLIIEHLTQAVSAMMTPAIRAQVLEVSAEDLLRLMYSDEVPLQTLELSVEWRQKIASPDITQIS